MPQSRLLLTFILSTLAALAGAAHPDEGGHVTYGDARDGRILVLGCVTNNPKYNYGRMQGIAEYVLNHMRDLGVDAVEVFTVDEADKMTRLLRDGRVDWVSATPFSAVRYLDDGNGQLLLAKSQRDQAWYRSVFVTRKDSGIDSLDDLLGKTIAFENPGSTSAYFVPATMLRRAGMRLIQLRSVNERPPPDAVGYLFSGDESNSTLWVHKNIVSAVAYSDGDWLSTFIVPDTLREDLTIFAQSNKIPRGVEIVNQSLGDDLKQRLKDTLLAAPDDPDAAAALNQFYRTTGYREVDDEVLGAIEKIRVGIADLQALDRH